MPEVQNQCKRCGTCCLKGGPALHKNDLDIVLKNDIRLDQLVTIRRGEPALSPLGDKLQYLQSEIIKLKGQGSDWACLFFDRQNSGCTIYENRPMECILLKCWDSGDLEQIINMDLLQRVDILPQDSPIIEFMANHEKQCSLSDLKSLLESLSDTSLQDDILAQLTDMVRQDMVIRSQAMTSADFPAAIELFVFGRPLFLILNNFGIRVIEMGGTLSLQLSPDI